MIGLCGQGLHEVVNDLMPLGWLVQVGRMPGLGQLLGLGGGRDLLQVLLGLTTKAEVVLSIDDLRI